MTTNTLSYKNPLDDYASFSVHYVMLATRSTEDAQAFVDTGKNADTLAAIEKVKLLGDMIPYGGSSTAYLVMDTRRFSQFTIEKLKYDVWINGVIVGHQPGNFASNVELTIIDSVGISFINFLQWLMNEKMQTNFNGIVWMLRVLFVGHKPDGSSSTVQSVTIPMMMDNVELNLDYSRGTYTATFLPYTNFDAVVYRRWLNIANAANYFTGVGNNTLGAIIDNFELRLNEQSQKYFDEASVRLEEAGRLRNPHGKFGRVVKYQITVPTDWLSMPFTGASTHNSTETIFQRALKQQDGTTAAETAKIEAIKAGKPIDSHMSVPTGMQITEVLDLIFKQVKDIADLGAGRKVQGEGGSITFYKHIVSLSSDDHKVVVHIDVVPFKVPNVYLSEQTTTIAKDQDDIYQLVDGVRVPKNYFELDYIFTGKNTQILNFDMKFQDLNIFLRSNLALGADAIAGITSNAQRELSPNQRVDKTSELVQVRAYDPLLLPKNTEAEFRNFTNYSAQLLAERGPEFKQTSQDYTRNLSMFYAMSPVKAALTIKGNPLIMDKFNIGDFVPNVSSTTAGAGGTLSAVSATSKKQYRKDFEAKILKNNTGFGATSSDLRQEGSVFTVNSPLGGHSYTTQPVFFKINIKGPNVNFITTETVHGEEFSKEVLYQNYYMVQTVSNVIEGGNFTQNLELWSHNVFGYGKITPSGDKEPRKL